MMTSTHLVVLHDRLMALGLNIETCFDLLKLVSFGRDGFSDVIEGLRKHDQLEKGRISNPRICLTQEWKDGTFLPEEIVNRIPSRYTFGFAEEVLLCFEGHKHLLSDPNTFLELLRGGIRIPLLEFLSLVPVDSTRLEKIFPLLSDTLWKLNKNGKRDDEHLFNVLEQFVGYFSCGRTEVVEAIWQLPDVVEHFGTLQAKTLSNEFWRRCAAQ
jgi:hypothetical protein